MAAATSLQTELVKKIQNFRESVPVFPIRERKLPDLEREAMQLATQFSLLYSDTEPRFHYRRANGTTVIRLPGNAQLALFHNSGAMVVRRILPPFEKMIGAAEDSRALIERAHGALKKLGLERWAGEDRLGFERLFQIKANGAIREGRAGDPFLTRAVGAFRRYIGDLPVFGRASVFIKLAGEEFVESVGLDLRVRRDTPIDYARVIHPEAAAERIISELSAGLPGATLGFEHYTPEMFGLGYFSLPKRRAQSIFQPVYVATFRSAGWTTLNRLIVIPASFQQYESIARFVGSPPRSEAKPSPTPRVV
jgi:hypothetical protein